MFIDDESTVQDARDFGKTPYGGIGELVSLVDFGS